MCRLPKVVLAVVASLAVLSFVPLNSYAASNDLTNLKGIDTLVTIRFNDLEASKVFDALGSVAGFEVSLAEDIKDTRITFTAENLVVKEVLDTLSKEYGLKYQVTADGNLEVAALK